jgi:hypothetical protein
LRQVGELVSAGIFAEIDQQVRCSQKRSEWAFQIVRDDRKEFVLLIIQNFKLLLASAQLDCYPLAFGNPAKL